MIAALFLDLQSHMTTSFYNPLRTWCLLWMDLVCMGRLSHSFPGPSNCLSPIIWHGGGGGGWGEIFLYSNCVSSARKDLMSWALWPEDSHKCETFLWRMWLLFHLFLIGRELFYNVMLVSAIQHRRSVISTYIYIYIYPLPLEPPSHPSRSSQSMEFSSMLYSSFPLAMFYTW